MGKKNPCAGISKQRQNEIAEDLLFETDMEKLKANMKKYTPEEIACALKLEERDSKKFG